ncbi:MAG: beta-ketoacyl-ACP synthase II [Vulcanimicrobiota bacterium]
MDNNNRRVVVTGISAVSPFGVGIDVLWKNLIAGNSAVGKITQFNPEGFSAQIAAEVKDFNPEDFMARKEAKRYDRFLQFSKAATKLCMDDCKLEITEELSYKIGCAIGSGIGGMSTFQSTHETLLEKGPGRVSPFFIPMMLINMCSGLAAIDYNLKGPNFSIVTACATGNHNIGFGFETIRSGKADLMLVGGSEGSITPLAVAGFSSMKAISFNNDNPEKASRPFDKKRDGFVMAEGASVLMLEELKHAKARNAHIYAEVVGFGMSADAYHITQPMKEGDGPVVAMNIALKDAGIEPAKIDYINAHGTSTPLGDIAETNAIKRVFGEHAKKVAISSTKSMIGHLLGAAGAIEALISILATVNDEIPPTINQEEPDPECDLNYVPNTSEKRKVEYAMSNSFGFGGTNSVIVVKKYNG